MAGGPYRRHPANSRVLHNLGVVLDRLGRSDDGYAILAAGGSPGQAEPAFTALFSRFESLGENCQFGIVQNRFGATPLGLLRFASVPVHALLRLLESRLEGVGEAGITDAVVSEFGEYNLSDRRLHLVMHTYVTQAMEPDGDAQAAKFLRRLRYLRRELLDDLQEATKLFVHVSPAPVPDEVILALWQALQGYGPNRLLFAMPADAGHPAGTLRHINETLSVGRATHFDNNAPDLPTWLQLCQQFAARHPLT